MKALFLGLAALVLACAAPAKAELMIDIKVAAHSERMEVIVDGVPTYSWSVSTARAGMVTPVGVYHVQSMDADHYSTLYNSAPMPHAIFFNGNIAIHGIVGAKEIAALGTPASHGCVRLHPQNAGILYNLVRQRVADTVIVVHH
ncbi:MAG TPA: L,D-transpeptidase [Candidatus Paceibacterota bacterium]|nr:L,D-transpeptidase [Candidatus Paceibacterota bacterium]